MPNLFCTPLFKHSCGFIEVPPLQCIEHTTARYYTFMSLKHVMIVYKMHIFSQEGCSYSIVVSFIAFLMVLLNWVKPYGVYGC